MYKALALQLTCHTLTANNRSEAETSMLATVARLDQQLDTAVGLAGRDTLLVVAPEFFLTGPPQGQRLVDWRDKATLEPDGPVYEALGAMVQRHKLYFSGNAYEQDPHFPDLYFQTSFIINPGGDVILRYRHLNSLLAPTPHDVWAYYLEAYGYDSVFPVARTNIGNLACMAADDILFPEVARCLAMRGAEIFLHATSESSSPLLTPQNVAKLARAAENMGYMVSANSAGVVGGASLADSANGGSKVVDYRGLVLAEASHGESMVANADIDLSALRQYRQRPGAANLLSRQRFELYADSYARHSYYPPNTLLAETPDQMVSVKNQQEVIKRLFDK